MNQKTVKIIRFAAGKMGVTYESAKKAFQNLSRPDQLLFVKKAKERKERYARS